MHGPWKCLLSPTLGPNEFRVRPLLTRRPHPTKEDEVTISQAAPPRVSPARRPASCLRARSMPANIRGCTLMRRHGRASAALSVAASPEFPDRRPEVRLFGPFRLDVRDERLWRGAEELKLSRKPFAILRCLTDNPRRLATQEELVEAVWGKIAMSDSLLRSHLSEVRRVLGDGAIETVVGRGYRFLLDVEVDRRPTPPRRDEVPAQATSLVGRSGEMDVLRQVFQNVLDEKRQVLFVMGDPGIGKTTVVDALLDRVATHDTLVVRGCCVEQTGAGEAYLPVLTALGAACRAFDGQRIVEVLRRHAPTWLAQMPAFVPDEELQALHARIQGVTQARMLRELAEALDVLAAERPVVLVLEDMQWSDRSTTDLVSTLGARREPARVLVVATCRPAELVKGDGVARVIPELRAHKQATALYLEALPEAAVADYLTARFPDADFPKELAGTIHRMTGGNPLFVVAVVDDLESRQMIRFVDGRWELDVSVDEVARRRPDTVRQLIDIQIDRLTPSEQRILEAASLVGTQFAAATVAHALQLRAEEVDSVCEGLADKHPALRFVSSDPWPDGTLQSHYAFVHALYRDAALARVLSATKRVWHRRIADALETACGGSAGVMAAELAGHFEAGHAVGKAVRYYCEAGERTMRRFGCADALGHFRRARALVASLPASEESDRTELVVLRHVAAAMVAHDGAHDPLLASTLERIAELAQRLGDDPVIPTRSPCDRQER
jgi:DNA-binding winged helix-turn-helix (wHTH) protein